MTINFKETVLVYFNFLASDFNFKLYKTDDYLISYLLDDFEFCIAIDLMRSYELSFSIIFHINNNDQKIFSLHEYLILQNLKYPELEFMQILTSESLERFFQLVSNLCKTHFIQLISNKKSVLEQLLTLRSKSILEKDKNQRIQNAKILVKNKNNLEDVIKLLESIKDLLDPYGKKILEYAYKNR